MLSASITRPATRWRRTRVYNMLLPSGWQEVPEHIRMRIVRLMAAQENQITGKVLALRVLAKLPESVFRALEPDHISDLLGVLPWLELKPDTTPLFSMFRHKGIAYHFPMDKFANGACIEYPMADDAYMQYVESKDKQHLVLLAAVLCREENPDAPDAAKRSDIRVPLFSKVEAEARAIRLKDIDETLLLTVALYWAGIKQFIYTLYGKHLFVVPDEDADANTSPPPPDPLGWWGRYMDAAAGDLTKLDSILQLNFHTFCNNEVRTRQRAIQEAQRAELRKNIPE